MVKTTCSVCVETSGGRLKGYTSQDVCVFLGIRYAEAGRFQMPTPVRPWSGVTAAVQDTLRVTDLEVRYQLGKKFRYKVLATSTYGGDADGFRTWIWTLPYRR